MNLVGRADTGADGALTGQLEVSVQMSGFVGEESRLKAGCSQDWLPHIRFTRSLKTP